MWSHISDSGRFWAHVHHEKMCGWKQIRMLLRKSKTEFFPMPQCNVLSICSCFFTIEIMDAENSNLPPAASASATTLLSAEATDSSKDTRSSKESERAQCGISLVLISKQHWSMYFSEMWFSIPYDSSAETSSKQKCSSSTSSNNWNIINKSYKEDTTVSAQWVPAANYSLCLAMANTDPIQHSKKFKGIKKTNNACSSDTHLLNLPPLHSHANTRVIAYWVAIW